MPTDYEARRRREAAKLLAHAQMAPRKKPGLGRNRFTLRALFALMLVCAGIFAWVSYHVRESLAQRRIAAALGEKQCFIGFGTSHLPDWFVQLAPVTIPMWMERAESIMATDSLTAEDLALVERLPELQRVILMYRAEAPTALADLHLARFKRLDELGLHCEFGALLENPKASSMAAEPALTADLSELITLPRLKRVSITGFTLSEKQLGEIVRIQQLVALDLHATGLPDQWLQRLPVLPHLKSLGVVTNNLTIDDVRLLAKHPSLEELFYHRPELRPDVLEKVQRWLPQCRLSNIDPESSP